MKDKLKELLKSKKFLSACGGVVVVLVSGLFGIPEESVQQVVYLVIAYIAGQSLVDYAKEK